ncbi:hypothetical protein MgSA37_04180 [Mucilaginibacter gotjawali]|uniref:Uncharacterized protein n=2 Tax=Mucilaginibacter gotjawali TaxID=1550579 RepID=A0A120MZE4_9SPHI|nr:hypothetical protein [Mucilaginibacter gotjawali]BAU55988.1 hypothetical protein MgSA37_04180 [Mucilaginibacter gotjawali]
MLLMYIALPHMGKTFVATSPTPNYCRVAATLCRHVEDLQSF